MSHHANPNFWKCYNDLHSAVKDIADKNFLLLKKNPRHPSLHLKKVGRFRSVRIGKKHRAIGVESADGIVWFWIGHHDEYNKIIKS